MIGQTKLFRPPLTPSFKTFKVYLIHFKTPTILQNFSLC